MSQTYLLVYDGETPPRPQLLSWLDAQPRVLNWHASQIHNLIVVLWEGPVGDLRDWLRTHAGLVDFVLVAAGPDKLGTAMTGWMARATWDFIASARPVEHSAGAPTEALTAG
jgi:hypothetical protein